MYSLVVQALILMGTSLLGNLSPVLGYIVLVITPYFGFVAIGLSGVQAVLRLLMVLRVTIKLKGL